MYKPEYCEVLKRMGSEGKSVKEFYKYAGISSTTFYKWVRKHPEFKAALGGYPELKRQYRREKMKKEREMSDDASYALTISYRAAEGCKGDIIYGTGVEYKPEYIRQMIKYAGEGCTFYEICNRMGINKMIFRQWMKEHPEIINAVETAKMKLKCYWIKVVKQELKNRFDLKLFEFLMLNDFGFKEITEEGLKGEEVQYVIELPEMKCQEDIEEEKRQGGDKRDGE